MKILGYTSPPGQSWFTYVVAIATVLGVFAVPNAEPPETASGPQSG